jgi:GNAT superfamily N-acetyltransferase
MVMEDISRLAHAVEANWCAAWASLGAVPDQLPTIVDDVSTYLRVYTPGVPEMLVNTVIRYSGPEPVAASDLESVIAPYRRHRVPFQWWLTLGAEPAGLREQLARLHLQSVGGATAMALTLKGWTPANEPFQAAAPESHGRVTTHEAARAALAVICDVFYVPPGPMARWTIENPLFRIYLTQWAGQPVSALATLRDGATVGIYHVATLPGFRRRGLAGRLLSTALCEAQAEGCTLATLTATPEARPLYASLGFRACGAIEQWVPGPELMAGLRYGGRSAQVRGGVWW